MSYPAQPDTLGLYLSIPFCKHKCTFCNFASGVFPVARLDLYVDRLCAELAESRSKAASRSAHLSTHIDTIYFGGGTPSLLERRHLDQIFQTIRTHFTVSPQAEITLEAAPNQLSEETLAAAKSHGVNRISLGVQSFIDRESAAVGRLHTAADCHAELDRMRAAGLRTSLDLIAGLPLQTEASWNESLSQAIATGTGHISVYLLEVDEDSRLGREALAHGPRFHAPSLPSDDATADWYQSACHRLAVAGLAQYEISNFARPGHQSRHNLKYWRRHPYLGVGLDAHSMLPGEGHTALRWANPDDLNTYLAEGPFALYTPPTFDTITLDQAFEESLFLGLRLNAGLDLNELLTQFGATRVNRALASLRAIEEAGLVTRTPTTLNLTPSGRLASNEVFSRLLVA